MENDDLKTNNVSVMKFLDAVMSWDGFNTYEAAANFVIKNSNLYEPSIVEACKEYLKELE